MDMSNEAQMALNIIESTAANLFLTGKAGTGKTTFLKELRRRSPKRMVVLAPTGIAAINAGGQTIHSFFQLPLSPFIPGTAFNSNDSSRRFKFSNLKRNIIKTLDLLVIDEISMVRSDLLDAVDDAMRRYRQPDKPFGGAQLLMIGDLHQLAPVTTPAEESLLNAHYATPFFFSSKALQQAGYLTIELKKVYRQQDSHFVDLLNQIRSGQANDDTLAQLNSRFIPSFQPSTKEGYIRLTTHNYPAQQINEQELTRLQSVAYTYEAEIEGDFPEFSYPTEARLTLKQGAQVMFIKNDPEHRFYNGMIGEITRLDNDEVWVKSKETGEEFELEYAEWTNSKYTLNDETKEIEESIEGFFHQYPLRLAWAITIHKSQGLTFEHAIIDASRSFTHGQTYVALSRCKSLEGMVLSQPLTRQSIIKDDTIEQFTSQIQTPSAATISTLQQAFCIRNIDELFGLSSLAFCHEQIMRTIAEFFPAKYQKLLTEYQQKTVVYKSMMQVAAKFRLQYTRMIAERGTLDNAEIQDRIHKGAAFFADKMGIFRQLLNVTVINTDNKVARKQLSERLQNYTQEVLVKQQLLNHYATPQHHFSTSAYLKLKAHLLLGVTGKPETAKKDRTAKKKETKVKGTKAKEPKIPTKQISYELYKKGMNVEQIARQRQLATGTILSHLSDYVVDGQLPLYDFVSEEHAHLLQRFLMTNPEASWTEVRSALGDEISYDEIRIMTKLTKAKE